MPHLYFVRHGQTIWNVENKICGSTDIALTPLGHEQAIAAGKLILERQYPIDAILYSPLMRAADTAKHIAEVTGLPAFAEPRLREQNFGKYESTARMVQPFSRQKHSLRTTMRVENPCCSWHSGFIIFWMNSCSRKRIICWLHTMALLGLCVRIFRI